MKSMQLVQRVIRDLDAYEIDARLDVTSTSNGQPRVLIWEKSNNKICYVAAVHLGDVLYSRIDVNTPWSKMFEGIGGQSKLEWVTVNATAMHEFKSEITYAMGATK